MPGFKYAAKCVYRGMRAVGHAVWVGFQYQGYVRAMGMLPPDDTRDLVNPELEEYNRQHPEV